MKFKKNYVYYIISGIFAILAIISSTYTIGWEKGAEAGFDVTIDTIQNIIDKQIKANSNTCTKLIFKDTLVYYISHKTIIR
jgi:hypothetical protein